MKPPLEKGRLVSNQLMEPSSSFQEKGHHVSSWPCNGTRAPASGAYCSSTGFSVRALFGLRAVLLVGSVARSWLGRASVCVAHRLCDVRGVLQRLTLQSRQAQPSVTGFLSYRFTVWLPPTSSTTHGVYWWGGSRASVMAPACAKRSSPSGPW
eukprot:scaffold4044_cov399-Prasinococcus_capsulatus_cf.AAC.8